MRKHRFMFCAREGRHYGVAFPFFYSPHLEFILQRRPDSCTFPRNAFAFNRRPDVFLLFSVYYYSGADATLHGSVMRCLTKSHAELFYLILRCTASRITVVLRENGLEFAGGKKTREALVFVSV